MQKTRVAGPLEMVLLVEFGTIAYFPQLKESGPAIWIIFIKQLIPERKMASMLIVLDIYT